MMRHWLLGAALAGGALVCPSVAQDAAAPAAGALKPGAANAAQSPVRVVTPEQEAAALADAQRSALTVTAYDLQVHLQPAGGKLNVLARLVVRNDGAAPLTRLALQLSSTLRWESLSVRKAGGAPAKLSFDQHVLQTDADHTGSANEAVAGLPEALAPGKSLELTAFYSGTVAQAATPLERAGAPVDAAALADWDAVGEDGTFLRGFGQVLWYPVASPQVFLGDGARFAEAVGEQRRRGSGATARLRLEVESAGTEPKTVFFCGRRAELKPVTDGAATGEESETRVATAELAAETLGFGPVSLFVVNEAAVSPEPGVEPSPVTVLSEDANAASGVEAAARSARGLVAEWLGTLPERQAVLLDHRGQPFAQGALLLQSAPEAEELFAMTHLESHAWFRAGEVWLDEGVAQFLPLLAVEQGQGRPAAVARVRDLQPALQLAESAGPNGVSSGESLVQASREVTYRNKAVAVLWMLRGLAGDEAMRAAFAELKTKPLPERNAHGFERALARASGKDLDWFFRDWVYQDKGLPELTILSAAPHPVPGTGGRPDGALVAVEVRNDGDAVADVPVTVRSGELTATDRLRIAGRSTAAVRILFQGRPEQVQVNDGTVPEAGESTHLRQLSGTGVTGTGAAGTGTAGR